MNKKENNTNTIKWSQFCCVETFPKILYSLALTRWPLRFVIIFNLVRSFVAFAVCVSVCMCVCVLILAWFYYLPFDNLFFRVLFACINHCIKSHIKYLQCLAHLYIYSWLERMAIITSNINAM